LNLQLRIAVSAFFHLNYELHFVKVLFMRIGNKVSEDLQEIELSYHKTGGREGLNLQLWQVEPVFFQLNYDLHLVKLLFMWVVNKTSTYNKNLAILLLTTAFEDLNCNFKIDFRWLSNGSKTNLTSFQDTWPVNVTVNIMLEIRKNGCGCGCECECEKV
jgi:hypothetical protein